MESVKRGEAVKLPEPEWMSEDITYYCGKAYKIGYDFASFISKSKQCAEIHNQHDIKDENGFRPFSVTKTRFPKAMVLGAKTAGGESSDDKLAKS